MKKICVVTSTRAEYGLLSPLIKKIEADLNFELQLVVYGTHLSQEYGYTVSEIKKDGVAIKKALKTIPNSPYTAVTIFANTVQKFEKCFKELAPHAVILLGDRSETLAVASVCLMMQIPIIHLCGGDTTFGAIDEACRHSITKMAALHFTGNEQMRKRVVQMGENPSVVFDTGETGVENILNVQFMSKKELSESIHFDITSSDYCVVTFHPVTTERGSEVWQISQLMNALDTIDSMKFIITKSNADDGGNAINKFIEEFVKDKEKFCFVDSLGLRRYLSALKYSKMMIGNSSSGIMEAPVLRVPTVNIGNRQEGRLQVKSIINCVCEKNDIIKAIHLAQDSAFIHSLQDVQSPYGDGHASEKMLKILHDNIDNLTAKKIFYDVEFEEK